MSVVGLVAAVSPHQQQPTFRGGARFVRVDVYPTDSNGKPIEDLRAADFVVFEDGKPQAIDSFEFVRIEPEPENIRVDPNSQQEAEALAKDPRARVFAIVLDTRHVDLTSGRSLRAPLVQMLDRLIGPRDMFGVTTPELPASSFLLGRKSGTVADMLERYWLWGVNDSIHSQDETERLFETCLGHRMSSTGALTQELVARHRERQTLEHLSALVDKLQSIRDERKSVVLVTQGWRLFVPNPEAVDKLGEQFKGVLPPVTQRGGRIRLGAPSPSLDGFDKSECFGQANGLLMMESQRAFKDLLDKAARANVAFYPIDPRGLSPFDQPISLGVEPATVDNARVRSRAEGLRTLAANTDGAAFIMNNDLDTQFRMLTDALSAYYLLGYYSTNTTFDGKYRRLEVKVKRPGVRVKARRGYFAPTREEFARIEARREPSAGSANLEAAALSPALGRLAELRHDRDLFLQGALLPGGLIVSAELGLNARTSPAWTNGGEVRFTITSGAGEVTETRRLSPLQSGIAIRVSLGDPRSIRVDVKARAATAGPFAAADSTLTLAKGPAVLIGDVMSYRGARQALLPAADGRYRRTERCTIEAPLQAGAIPAGARVVDRTGRPLSVPVALRERVDASGIPWIVAELVLAPLTDGDYVIEIEATKDAARERKLFAIRVVR